MEWDKLADILNEAIKQLLHYDGFLFETTTNQRTYCARLMRHLEPLLWEKLGPKDLPPSPDEYRVDVEYNRNYRGEEENWTKKLLRGHENNSGEKSDESSVLPDLNIHCRGPSGPNLLVAEVVNQPNRVDADSVRNFWKVGWVCGVF
jgi:hypothetical protein